MNAARLVTQSVHSMGRYRLRTAFMMLGSFIGVAALTFAVSLGQGVQVKVLRTVRQIMGDASIVVVGGGGRMMGSPRAGAARLTIDDVSAVATEVPGIVDWDPQAELSGMAVRRGDVSATVRLLGQSERWQRVGGRGIASGEGFDASAVTSAARVAVIGETVARALFANEDPVGSEIQIGSVAFKVIGVMERFGVDMHGMDRDDEIVVPISTLMRRLTNADAIGTAKMIVRDPARAGETASAVTDVLRRRHALNRDQPDDFRIITALQAQEMVAMVRRVLLLYVPLVSGVVLIVGGIVAATLMLGSVNERVGEIGLRRAVGAMPTDIRRQFAVETAVTIVAGGVAGIAIGYLGVYIAATHFGLGSIFSWSAVLVSITASAMTGWLAGVLPARRAAALNPADALR
ncbi:MAG: ABC transporter permease [Gemmatimonadaceae bacterium]